MGALCLAIVKQAKPKEDLAGIAKVAHSLAGSLIDTTPPKPPPPPLSPRTAWHISAMTVPSASIAGARFPV